MTGTAPSRLIRLYGTEEPAAKLHKLTAGALSLLFDGANLRDIRFNGEEVMRAVSFIVRDKDWATWDPKIEQLEINEDTDRFVITYHAVAGSGRERFEYQARIEGSSDGVLSFAGQGETPHGMLINRTGFVVLHPIEGISGSPVTIRHTDGREVEGRFPGKINPIQPMMDLRELVHHTPGGQRVSCLMQGDAFEMEDQRNWTDASYKTYVRPLALPWPYRIEPGENIAQKITLTVSGTAPAIASAGPVEVRLGEVSDNIVPPLGLGLQPEDAKTMLENAEALSGLGAHHVICHYDPRRGHDAGTLKMQADAARAIGAVPWLEAVIENVEDIAAGVEVAALGKIARDLGDPFETVLVSPASDLKCTLPGSPWPPAPDAERLYHVTRSAFPKARIGGGMFSFFTELNRKRPPTEALDLITFTTAAIFHAGDDRSMMQTLECLPHMTRTVPDIAQGLPYSVGPSAISMRDNPYGEAALANPDNIRQAVNFNDPRQRGIIGAAWHLGYFAAFAQGGAHAIALGAAVGAFGVMWVPSHFPQPWFDGNGGFYPVWHVLRGLARLAGQRVRVLDISVPEKIRGLAVDTRAGAEIWLCNTQAEETVLQLDGITGANISVLSAETFVQASRRPDLLDIGQPLTNSQIKLDAFSVIRISMP